MKTLLTIIITLTASIAYPCNNDCWLSKNKEALDRVIKSGNAKRLQPMLDAICEQGRPITKQQRRLARRLHLKKCGVHAITQPTPTATPYATPTPTPRPTPSSTPTATPHPTPTITPTPTPSVSPSVSPTPTPHPTPTPSVSPTASPTCTPQGNCTQSTIEWAADYPDWPDSAFPLQLGNSFYTKEQSFSILTYPGFPNDGLNPLCREMVAARLNIADGAGHECADQLIMQAQLIIGDLVPKPVGNDTIPLGNVQDLINELSAYNKGDSCCAARCTK